MGAYTSIFCLVFSSFVCFRARGNYIGPRRMVSLVPRSRSNMKVIFSTNGRYRSNSVLPAQLDVFFPSNKLALFWINAFSLSYPSKTDVFGALQETACLSVCMYIDRFVLQTAQTVLLLLCITRDHSFKHDCFPI